MPNRVFEIVQENTSLRLDLLFSVFAVEIAQHDDDLPLSARSLSLSLSLRPNKDHEPIVVADERGNLS